jgi:hypothetical protein
VRALLRYALRSRTTCVRPRPGGGGAGPRRLDASRLAELFLVLAPSGFIAGATALLDLLRAAGLRLDILA